MYSGYHCFAPGNSLKCSAHYLMVKIIPLEGLITKVYKYLFRQQQGLPIYQRAAEGKAVGMSTFFFVRPSETRQGKLNSTETHCLQKSALFCCFCFGGFHLQYAHKALAQLLNQALASSHGFAFTNLETSLTRLIEVTSFLVPETD